MVAGYPVVGTISGDDGQPRPDTSRPFRTIELQVEDYIYSGNRCPAGGMAVHGKEKVYGSIP
jgi:hypothetical protein